LTIFALCFSCNLICPTSTYRTIHFFANSDKAKLELGWAPKHTFLTDVDELAKAYFASGRDKKEIDFSIDDKIIQALGK
jgi:hypothetical protein